MEKRYMISDAAKLVEVEAHVLRYWEEELSIEVPRNEMGHRYYTDFHVKLFKGIKCLKDRGFLLRAIKMVLPELAQGKDPKSIDFLFIEDPLPPCLKNASSEPEDSLNELTHTYDHHLVTASELPSGKMEQFQEILGNIVTKAIIENNELLGSSISSNVSTSVIKEIDYLLRVKEEREEERYKKLDESIRTCQQKARKMKKKLFTKKALF